MFAQSRNNRLGTSIPVGIAGWSLRHVNPIYAGNCIRVRRSSDNAQQDIGFFGGNLDVATLMAFVGGGTGFVVTWYNQSGSGDATQATTSLQPQVVTSGVLQVDNLTGKPTIVFNQQYLAVSGSVFGSVSQSDTTTFVVVKLNTIRNVNGIFYQGASTFAASTSNFGMSADVNNITFDVSTAGGSGRLSFPVAGMTSYELWENISSANLSTHVFQSNGGALSTSNATYATFPTSSVNLYLGALDDANSFTSRLTGNISELHIYNKGLLPTQRDVVRNNINAFYSIY